MVMRGQGVQSLPPGATTIGSFTLSVTGSLGSIATDDRAGVFFEGILTQPHHSASDAAHVLRGSEAISYTNNSPSALDELWVQLDQNIYRTDSRGRFSDRYLAGQHTAGDVIDMHLFLEEFDGDFRQLFRG